MQSERLPNNFFRSPQCMSLGERLDEVDTNLKGMELALSCTNSFPVALDEDLKHGLNRLEEHVSLTIKHAKHSLLGCGGSLTVPESSAKNTTHFLQSLHTIPTTLQELPTFFFFFCAKLFHKKSLPEAPIGAQDHWPVKKNEGKENWADWATTTLRATNLVPAIKFSFSLGLSVFMGLLYSKENGFWAGLPVAVSYVSGREATFRAANVKAQGTVLGTVYGVLGCFVFERLVPIRFLSLLPWFIFTSFLQRSRMYGPSGGISAVIGAVLILGRKNFGPPSEFAIARIVETFIGLSCSIFVDLLRPKRASSCAETELSQCLATLGESIGSLSLLSVAGKTDSQSQLELEDHQRRLKKQVNELKKFIIEAEAEPNFWFLPFHSACYNRLLGSLSRLVDVLHFAARALKSLQQEFHGKEEVNMLQVELGRIKELVCSSIKILEEISKMKSLKLVEKELEKKKKGNNVSCDIESGKSTECGNTWMISGLGEDGIGETIGSFLQKSRDVVDDLYGGEGEKEVKSEVVMSLSAVGFCLSACMQGTMEIEEAIRELVQWENPSSEVNLCEVSCKLHTLNK